MEQGQKISSNFDFNMITLRIEPFWNFDKKNFSGLKNFLSVEPGWPHNGDRTKISSNFDFNMITLRIGPFRNFFKKFSFFDFFSVGRRACPGMPRSYYLKYLDFLKRFRPAVFCVCSALSSSTFCRLITKISIVVSEKIPKNLYFGPKMAQIWAAKFFFSHRTTSTC